MGIALSAETKALLDRPNFAHLATLLKDGAPHSAPVWIAREGDRLLIVTEGGSLKGRNTARDPRVSISIVDFDDPYTEAQIQGRVVERRADPELNEYDSMSRKYVGCDWPYRDAKEPLVLVIEVVKEHSAKQPFEHTPTAR
jgi:PPOX class probable F420-dependent enzyme